MSTAIKCSFCNQDFDFDNSSENLLLNCPHCGKQNSVAVHSVSTQRLRIIRDAPSLIIGKYCPECAKPIDRDATICVHCGYHLAIGKKLKGVRVYFLGRKSLIRLCQIILLGMVAFGAYLLSPQFKKLLPPIVSTVGTGITVAIEGSTEPLANLDSQSTIITHEVQKEHATIAHEEDPRLLFEAQKAKAEEVFRCKLNASAPLYTKNDNVELRTKNGKLIRGSLLRSEEEGSNIVYIVASMTGEVRVLTAALDLTSRIRIDPEHREKYIQHMFNSRPSTPQTYIAGKE